jgi:hypothetical protein
MKLLLRYLFFLLIVLTTADVVAQVNDVRSGLRPSTVPTSRLNRVGTNAGAGKKLMAARNRFITQQLSLTDEESRKFWPMYNKYQQELTAVRILKRLNNSNANGADQVNKDLEYDSQMLVIKKKYRDEFYKILPPEKVSELYKSESEFKDELIKQLSERSIRAGN